MRMFSGSTRTTLGRKIIVPSEEVEQDTPTSRRQVP